MVELTRTSIPGQVSVYVQLADACWSNVPRSTVTSPAYCSKAVPASGMAYAAPWRTEQVVVRRSTSRLTVQLTPAGSSPEDGSPAVSEGAEDSSPAHSGSSSDPSCTVNVTGAGGATVFGQSAPATESRSR